VEVVFDAAAMPSVGLVDPMAIPQIRTAMSRHVGVLRDQASLQQAATALDEVLKHSCSPEVRAARESWEASNLLTVASAVVAAAAARTESRGCHRRTDFPDPTESWLVHLDVRMDAQGHLRVTSA
jgi:L-aspartate oxidase